MVEEMSEQEVLGTMIEIESLDQDQFLKVKESLTRIGVPSRKSGEDLPTLWQSCHVFHKQGRYYITHFKQLFMLDGRFSRTDFTDEDYDRLCVVASLLQEWGLIKIIGEIDKIEESIRLTIIPYRDKHMWNLDQKYSLGKHKRY